MACWKPGLSFPPAGISLTHAYKVVVTGIRRAGINRNLSHTYTVRLFTPSH